MCLPPVFIDDIYFIGVIVGLWIMWINLKNPCAAMVLALFFINRSRG